MTVVNLECFSDLIVTYLEKMIDPIFVVRFVFFDNSNNNFFFIRGSSIQYRTVKFS